VFPNAARFFCKKFGFILTSGIVCPVACSANDACHLVLRFVD
jgi:hypothetical protein